MRFSTSIMSAFMKQKAQTALCPIGRLGGSISYTSLRHYLNQPSKTSVIGPQHLLFSVWTRVNEGCTWEEIPLFFGKLKLIKV